jgi:hypothetical protein
MLTGVHISIGLLALPFIKHKLRANDYMIVTFVNKYRDPLIVRRLDTGQLGCTNHWVFSLGSWEAFVR